MNVWFIPWYNIDKTAKGASMTTTKQPLFTNLVFDEEGKQVETAFIGAEPHYVILDGDFRRHVAAEEIDRQVIEIIQQHAEANKELVSEQIMGLIGQDDLFTKAAIDSSIGKMEQVMQVGLPEDARMMLGMMGFKIIVNVHGEVVRLDMPGMEPPPGEGGWW